MEKMALEQSHGTACVCFDRLLYAANVLLDGSESRGSAIAARCSAVGDNDPEGCSALENAMRSSCNDRRYR